MAKIDKNTIDKNKFLTVKDVGENVSKVVAPHTFQVGLPEYPSDLIVFGSVVGPSNAPVVIGGAGGGIAGIVTPTVGSFTIPENMQTLLVGPVTIGEGSVMTVGEGARILIRDIDEL